jgi:geranylgeranyl pyrophosphate synthase
MVEGAKLHRAALVFAAGTTFGASSAALMPAAVSIELLHLASLVHDDIIDEASERRGVPALHVAIGRDRAVVVGDLLIAAAFEELARARPAPPPDAVMTLAEAARLCCTGELEALASDADSISNDGYLRIVAQKTGSLFSAAGALGGLAAGVGGDTLARLEALGTELGIAYQVQDDLHDGARPRPDRAVYEHAAVAARSAFARLPASSDELAEIVEALLCSA